MTTMLPSPEISTDGSVSLPDEQILGTGKTFAAISSSEDSIASEPDAQRSSSNTSDSSNSERLADMDENAKTSISKLLKGKEMEWTAVAQKKGPLRLLDLPVDVLKEIVKEVTHTNDLTSLALTHSALHSLAIPHIYSRFDIVWPDSHSTTDPRTGVDALTYGLATLVMGEDVFKSCPAHSKFSSMQQTCSMCGSAEMSGSNTSRGVDRQRGSRRFGNSYPQYTRKFSLGNGPADWVQEYMITKESGKMLGTLVALAVARMVNLETFVWDMPTGVLRDVWLALASLHGRDGSNDCRLERVWIRWHDNSDPAPLAPSEIPTTTANPSPSYPAGSTITPIGVLVPSGGPGSAQIHFVTPIPMSILNRVEHPSFSVLPPLKSLSVLDIDELAYLDEMSILIEKSKESLRELRVGISAKACWKDFAIAWDGPDLQQIDSDPQVHGLSSIGYRRLGGVLGVLLGRIFDIRKKSTPEKSPCRTHEHIAQNILSTATASAHDLNNVTSDAAHEGTPVGLTVPPVWHGPNLIEITTGVTAVVNQEDVPSTLSSAAENKDIDNSAGSVEEPESVSNIEAAAPPGAHDYTIQRPINDSALSQGQKVGNSVPTRKILDWKLKLEILELERVALSITVLQKAFDWSLLTSLTILECSQHESLWRMLRRQFQPQVSPSSTLSTSAFLRNSISSNTASKAIANVPMEYQLNLKKVHTDAASPALVAFLKETLAPNSLEVLFIQDKRRTQGASVTLDAIYRGPLKRHRGSLKKLLLDSGDKIPRGPTASSDSSARWRLWLPSLELLSFLTSGKIPRLKELSIALNYHLWHFFLQRLPQMPQLRSLNIPYIADHVTPIYDPRELALQVVDIISLRPEIELCYLGISHKCFEILENRHHEEATSALDAHGPMVVVLPEGAVDEEDVDDEEGSDDEVGDEDDNDDDGTAITGVEQDDESESSYLSWSDGESTDGSPNDRFRQRLRLREILFYDDKIAIFKARHGRL